MLWFVMSWFVMAFIVAVVFGHAARRDDGTKERDVENEDSAADSGMRGMH